MTNPLSNGPKVNDAYRITLAGPDGLIRRSPLNEVQDAQTLASILLDPEDAKTDDAPLGYLHERSRCWLAAIILSLTIIQFASLEDLSALLLRDVDELDRYCFDWLRAMKPSPTSTQTYALADDATAFVRDAFGAFVDQPTIERKCVFEITSSAVRRSLRESKAGRA